MSARVKRHPIMGFFAGLFFGLGIALLLFVFGVTPVTVQTLAIIVIAGIVLGVVSAYVARPRSPKARA